MPEVSDEIILTKPHLILCEGASDKSFLEHLLKDRGVEGFQLEVPVGGGGVNKYRQFLNALPLQRGYEELSTITLVGDNDISHKDPFHRLKQEIRESKVGYPVPDAPMVRASGASYPDMVGFLVPWADERGVLETIVLRAFSDEWPDVRAAADQLLAASPATGWNADEQAVMLVQTMIACTCKSDPKCSLTYIWSRPGFRDLIRHTSFNRIADFFQGLV